MVVVVSLNPTAAVAVAAEKEKVGMDVATEVAVVADVVVRRKGRLPSLPDGSLHLLSLSQRLQAPAG